MTASRIDYQMNPVSRVYGEIRVPGDKSISHRAVMLGALAEGITHVTGFLDGEDNKATVRAFRAMGIKIEEIRRNELVIEGKGLCGLKPPADPLDVGNSGTSMRILAGLLAAQPFDSILTGDESLSRRPMRRVTDPLQQMGAQIQCSADGTPPLTLSPASEFHGIDYISPVASAQVKSALLFAGIGARGTLSVTEPELSRDHTERMLAAFGYPIKRDGLKVSLSGGHTLTGVPIVIPGDISSAAFYLVAATIAPQPSELILRQVGTNPTRTGIITLLKMMGANIELMNEQTIGGEPRADLRVRSAPLKGIRIPQELIPATIDEFPALFIAAAAAEGETILEGAAELRVKESDRIDAMATGLKTLGIHAVPTPDGMILRGQPRWEGGQIDSRGDHRIAMSFAVASLRANSPITLMDCANIQTSFPGFVGLANRSGFSMERI